MAGMNAYEVISLAGGLQYLCLPLVAFFFPLPFQYMAWEPSDAFTPEILGSIGSMFTIVGATVGPTFIYSALRRSKKGSDATSFIDVTVMQRIVWVGALIVAMVASGQDPFGDFHWPMLMVAVDWMGGIAHGMGGEGGLGGCVKRLCEHYGSAVSEPAKERRALRVEGYLGMACGPLAVAYACLASEVTLGCLMAGVPAQMYLWFSWVGHDDDKGSVTFASATRFVEIAALALVAEFMGFDMGVVLPLRLWYGSLLMGALSSAMGAVAVALSGLTLYGLSCRLVQTAYLEREGPLYWQVGWGAATVLSSYVWLMLFYNSYDDYQRKKIMGTNYQDWTLGCFCAGTGAALSAAGYVGPGTVGEPVGYLLPVVTLWFSLETKMLTHMRVGTPFHPSWWADGKTSKHAPKEIINFTFGLGTLLITVVLTSYAWYAITFVAVGPSAFSFAFQPKDAWKFACVHGMTAVFHTGWWMVFASSGTDVVSEKWFPLPPKVPAFVQADVYQCVSLHKKDLALGIGHLMVGGLVLSGEGAHVEALAPLVKASVGLMWAFCIGMKVYIHVTTFGYVHPIYKDDKEGKKEVEGKKD